MVNVVVIPLQRRITCCNVDPAAQAAPWPVSGSTREPGKITLMDRVTLS